jgi:hypothetical protein
VSFDVVVVLLLLAIAFHTLWLVYHPAESPKAEYLREIRGDEMINEDTFAAQPMLQGFLSLIARHKDANPSAVGEHRRGFSWERLGGWVCSRDGSEKGRLDCST